MLKQLRDTLLEREALILLYVMGLFAFFSYHGHLRLLPARYGQLGTRLGEGATYLVLSALFIVVVLRENPLRFGLGPGRAAEWGRYLLLFVVIAAPGIAVAAWLDPSLRSYYPMYKPAAGSHWLFLLNALCTAGYMLGWEYLFRGFLLFGLEKRLGRLAAVLQAVPFMFVHIGKPEVETYSSILGGILLGVLALRTRSMWPCFLIHTFVAVWMDFCAVYLLAGSA